MVGQAAVPDLACRDELLERAPRLLDRHVAVGVVELQKVELLAPEPTQALLAAMADRIGAQVHEVVSVVATQRSALGEDEHVLAAGERAADDLLGVPPAVERSRVDPVDAAVQCGVDGPYRIGVVLRSQLTHHSPGREPMGAVPMPTREIRRSLAPRRRRSMTVSNEVRLARMPILRPEEETKVCEWFAGLARPVELYVALGPEETPRAGSGDLDFGTEMVRLCEGLAELGDGVTCRVEEEPEGFSRFPAVSIRPDGRDVGVRYDGCRGATSSAPSSAESSKRDARSRR